MISCFLQKINLQALPPSGHAIKLRIDIPISSEQPIHVLYQQYCNVHVRMFMYVCQIFISTKYWFIGELIVSKS